VRPQSKHGLYYRSMQDFITSAPFFALVVAVSFACYIRSVRCSCQLSTFWFIICLIAKALRKEAPPPALCRSSHVSATPPDVARARESLRRLVSLAAPLMRCRLPKNRLRTFRRSDTSIAGVKVRWYQPDDKSLSEQLPVVVFFHGGGWVQGDVETHDAPCAALGTPILQPHHSVLSHFCHSLQHQPSCVQCGLPPGARARVPLSAYRLPQGRAAARV
jgi:hypothetical protein